MYEAIWKPDKIRCEIIDDVGLEDHFGVGGGEGCDYRNALRRKNSKKSISGCSNVLFTTTSIPSTL